MGKIILIVFLMACLGCHARFFQGTPCVFYPATMTTEDIQKAEAQRQAEEKTHAYPQ